MEKEWHELRKSTAEDFEAWPELCKVLNDHLFTSKAINYLERKKQQGSNNYMLIYNLARCYYYLGSYDRVVKLLNFAVNNYRIEK